VLFWVYYVDESNYNVFGRNIMKKLILLLGIVFLFVGCGRHKNTFKQLDELTIVKKCPVQYSTNNNIGILQVGEKVIFNYNVGEHYTISVTSEKARDIRIHEECVMKDNTLKTSEAKQEWKPKHNKYFGLIDYLRVIKKCKADITTADHTTDVFLEKGEIIKFNYHSTKKDNMVVFSNKIHNESRVHEDCVEPYNNSSSETNEKVTMYKLQLKCVKDGKTTESVVDEIRFKSTEFVNCTVRQARIKYEPVISVVEE
jgi:hypothetical protein